MAQQPSPLRRTVYYVSCSLAVVFSLISFGLVGYLAWLTFG